MKAAFAISAILATVASAIPTPSNIVSSTVASTSSIAVTKEVHSVITVTNQVNKKVLVELDQTVANKLTGVSLGSVTTSVGTIVKTVTSLSQITSADSGLLTVVLSTGEYALIQLTDVVEDLLSDLGLGVVGDVVGSVVSTLEDVVEDVASNTKRSGESNLLSLTNLNGQTIYAEATGVLSELDLSQITGTVVAKVASVSALKSKVNELGLTNGNVIGVLAADGVSVLVVKIESTVTGLLSVVGSILTTLGLGDLTVTVASVVTTVESTTSSV
ncbi:uncharacterized protein N7483_007288 [Penicillium malachiteum]|uniref:uncharacterized protein n=1 Tax=Penicillium malachiteum TaxID=1324776 RepID=UPI0025492CE8|nr:uncharacterized protein N7483_007288 [Penicillium malachiteum]KAJ5725931.1 hypothetical protein N7483_007288 [Penicillium malachiteum]